MSESNACENLTEKQKEILKSFRCSVSDIIKPEHDDYFLLRWLRARNFNEEKAEAMLRKNFTWKIQYRIDSFFSWYKMPEVFQKYHPGGLIGHDKDGAPVWLLNSGYMDMKGFVNSSTKSEFLRYQIYRFETLLKDMREQSKELNKRIEKNIYIMDEDKLVVGNVLNKHVMETLLNVFAVFEANYPETLKRCFIINVPKLFYVLFSIIKPLLSEETANKVKIFGTGMNQQSSPSTILVTGGAGYVGSHAVLELLKSGYEVVTVDNYSNCYPGEDRSMPESLRRVQNLAQKELIFYEVDLLNKKAVDEVFSKHTFSCVVHFAALKAVAESCRIPLDYYRNNIVGTLNLLEAMSEFGVKKFVFSSSATVYGIPEYLPINEEHPVGTTCTNPYGRTKYFIEEILKDVCKSEKGWSIILLRYFNPVGAHESGEIGEDPRGLPNNLMPYIAQVAIGRRKKLEIFGNDYSTCDGTGVRDYIHVVDLAEGHVSAVKYLFLEPFEDCKVFNLGTGQGFSVLQVIHAFESVCGKKIPYNIVGRREGDVEIMYADVSRAKEYLHWESKHSLIQMCKDTWQWQKKNPMGFHNTQSDD